MPQLDVVRVDLGQGGVAGIEVRRNPQDGLDSDVTGQKGIKGQDQLSRLRGKFVAVKAEHLRTVSVGGRSARLSRATGCDS
jgi:hypothetical protein